MYGIEAQTAHLRVERGFLFGAIDVALFILVIGGFLGVTMQTGAIQTGITRVVERLRGRERLLIPILMIVFALGGTTYGMARRARLLRTHPVGHGRSRLRPTVAAALLLLGCGIGVLESTINPFATGIASGLRAPPSWMGSSAGSSSSSRASPSASGG